jgi:hypothetical protein
VATAVPLARAISKPPYVRLQAPIVWTTLRLTVYADGRSVRELLGAGPFPRHRVYDASGDLALKAGVADWRKWLGQPSWEATPWGAADSPVVVAQAGSGLERENWYSGAGRSASRMPASSAYVRPCRPSSSPTTRLSVTVGSYPGAGPGYRAVGSPSWDCWTAGWSW